MATGQRPTAKSALSKEVVQLSKVAFWRMGYRTHLASDSGCDSTWAGCVTTEVYNCSVHLSALCKGHRPAT